MNLRLGLRSLRLSAIRMRTAGSEPLECEGMEATGGRSVLNAYHLSCNLFEGFWLQDLRLKRFRVQDLEL